MNAEQKTSLNSKDIVLLGKIVSVFGVKGFVKINSFTDPNDNLVDYFNAGVRLLWRSDYCLKEFSLDSEWSHMPLEFMRAQANKIVGKIENCDDRDLAQKFKNTEIAIFRDDLLKFDLELEDSEFYWHDLEGLDVFDTKDVHLGKVASLLATGANDILVVKDMATGKECLIPFIYDKYVIKVDYDNKKIIVDWDLDF